jgi:DNA invertase Pin-like site-specific DNA recombinase
MCAALYLRVSTTDQTTANQERELRAAAERMGHEVVEVYADNGIDIVMTWSVDRLGRSLQDLVAFLSELHALGIELYLHQQGLDTTTPAGKAMFQMRIFWSTGILFW